MSNIAPSSQSKPRVQFPSWLRGPWGMVGIALIVYLFVFLGWTYFHWGGKARVDLIGNLAILPPILLAIITAFRVNRQPHLSVRVRRAWFRLGIAFILAFLGEASWAYLQSFLHIEPFPSIADIFFLGFYPVMLWGLLTMSSVAQTRQERLNFLLDLIIVFAMASMFVGYFLILPTAAVNNSDLLSQILATTYPVFSLILLGGVFALVLKPPQVENDSVLLFLLLSIGFYLASDLAFGYASLAGTYVVGGWIDSGWNIAYVLAVLAALHQMVDRPGSPFLQRWALLQNRFQRWVPWVAIVMGYGLVFYAVIWKDGRASEWLMAGALLLTLLVIARQIVSPVFVNLPIRTKVILTFTLVSVLSVSLVSAIVYLTIRSNLQSLAGDSLKGEVEIRAQTLGNEVAKQLDLLKGFVLGETIEYGIRDANARYVGGPDAIESQLRQLEQSWNAAPDRDPLVQGLLDNIMAKELRDFAENFPDHARMLLTDRYGATVAATTRPASYVQAQEDWWQAAYAHGRGAVYVGQPTFDPVTQDFRVIMAIPVREDHSQQVNGVLCTSVDIQNMLEFLIPAHVGTDTGFSLLLPNGSLLDAQGESHRLDADTRARLQASQTAGYAQLQFEGTFQMLGQAPIVSSPSDDAQTLQNLNWRLVAHEKPAITFAPLHSAGPAALFTTLFVLVLTSLVALILAQILIAPISRLTTAAGRIASGDLSAKAQVESKDEIGKLASTFNTMLNTLSHTQKELRESEAIYRSLVDYLPDVITVHGHGEILFINPAGAKLLGAQTAEELIGKQITELVPAGDRGSILQGIEHIQGIKETTPLIQQTLHRIDGTPFEAEFRAIPISYAGQPAIQFVMRDVTERKKAEEKIHQLLVQVARQRADLEVRVAQRTEELNLLNQRLHTELIERQALMDSLGDSEERFRLLFEASPDAILLIDPNDSCISWPIVDCNEVACAMNGYRREELIGRSVDLLNTTPGDVAERAEYLKFLRQQGVLHREGFHRHKDGHVFPIEVSSSLISFAGRELVLGIDRDITQRKQVEEALSQAKEAAEASQQVAEAASRAKSEFLSRMSHELRTPMNAILGFAQLLEMSQKEPLSSSQQGRVKQIVKGGQHLLDLINEILDISRIEANRLQISPEPVSIRESVQEVLDLNVPLAVKRHVQIVTRLGSLDSNPFVLADRQRLKQVLLNLLGNAVKYNFDGGSVIVSSQTISGKKWRISVSDTGPGIAQENLTRLFVPFERLNDDQPDVEGTGLGLVLAKRLIELMHGQIGVETTLGKGSTFWIELPAAESPVERLHRSGATGDLHMLSAEARTILYVEDNVANFELVREVLADYSEIKLLWATDVKTGLEQAREHQPHLILLDLHLGGVDGAQLLEQVKQDPGTAAIPVVVVSADATSGQARRLTSLGAYTYLTKPLDVKHFIHLVEDLLAEKEI